MKVSITFDTLADGIPERFFEKVDFEKICRQQKGMKNYPVGKAILNKANSTNFYLSTKGYI